MGHYFLDTQYVALKRIPVWEKMEIFEPPLVLEFVAKLQSLQASKIQLKKQSLVLKKESLQRGCPIFKLKA